MGKQPSAWFLAAILSCLVALAGCGGPTAQIGLSLDAGLLTVPLGGEAQLTVTLTRTGAATGPVELKLGPTPLPTGMSYSFTPAVLSGAATTSVLRVAADASAAEGPVLAQVSATSGALAASQPLTVNVQALTLDGVVTTSYGVPLAGVSAASQGMVTTTGPDGRFTLAGLAVPYDLTLYSAADEWVHRYEGLTEGDLTFLPAITQLPSITGESMQLTGTLSGGVLPVPAQHRVYVCVEGIDATVIGCGYVDAGGSTYAFTASWPAGTPAVKVHALEVERDGAGKPVAYLAYGSATTTLVDGVDQTLDIALGAGGTSRPLDIEVNVPAGWTSPGPLVALRLGAHHWAELYSAPSAPTFVEVPVGIAGLGSGVMAAGQSGSALSFAWDTEPTSTSVTLDVPESPGLLAPADAATGVTATTAFSLTLGAGLVPTYMWRPDVAGTGPTFALTTTRTEVRVPTLTSPALPLPTGSVAYDWLAWGDLASSVDQAASSLGQQAIASAFAAGFTGSGWGFEGSGAIAFAAQRSFTTAP